MANISALQEDFGGAAAGVAMSTSNTIVDALTGGGTSIFNADAYLAGTKSMEFLTTADFRTMRCDHSAAGGWRGFALKVTNDYSATTTIAAWYNNTTLGGTVQSLADMTLRIRDAGSVTRYTSPVLSVNTWYWISVKVDQNSARLKIYNGSTGALLHDSGALTTGFTTTNPDNWRIGPQTSTTGGIRIARMRGDTNTETAHGIVTANPIATGVMTAYHEIDTAGSNGTMTLVRTSGDAVTITGPTAGVFKIEHADPVVDPIGLTLTATDAGVPDTELFVIESGEVAASIINRRVWNGSAWV